MTKITFKRENTYRNGRLILGYNIRIISEDGPNTNTGVLTRKELECLHKLTGDILKNI